MKSVRLYLLKFLALALVLATTLLGALLYASTWHEVGEWHRTQLLQLATLVSAQQQGQPDCGWRVRPPVAAESPHDELDESVFVLQVWSREGALLHSTHPALQVPLQAQLGFSELDYGDRGWRAFRIDNGDCRIQVAQPNSAQREAVLELTHHILVPALLQLPLLAALIWLAVGRGLQPLRTLSRAIARRSPNALDPVPEEGLPSEVQPLVQALNQLLERLDIALRAQRQFTADAAHELRSPLTALQLQLELAQRATSDEERTRALAQLAAGIARGNRLVQQLLTLARLEPEAPSSEAGSLALDELTRAVAAEFAPLALAKDIDLGIERCEALCVHGDRSSLEILLGNLLDNAIRYTPASGRIDVCLYAENNCAVLDVIDNGTGIAAAERARVFDRFYRIDGSGVTGTGLGLAIVRAIADRHGGRVQALANPAGAGTLMRVSLPLAGR